MKLHLSPSEHHARLTAQTVPALRYAGGPVKPWQAKLRRKVAQLVGDMPAERCPLKPRQIWKKEHPLGTIEKVAFTSEPFVDVLAYVCLPKNATPPYRFMVCLQGHSSGMHNSIAVQREDESQPLTVAGDLDFGLGCMQRGIAALCIEQRSFGERREQIRPSQGCHEAAMNALMLGRTLTGERVYDVDRGLDYLAQRGDADLGNIGILGNSGGGTVGIFAAALLPRIAFAMPSCCLCTFRDSIMAMYHCEDNFIPGLLKQAEMADLAGLFAPKPVVFVAGKDDPLFPLKATRQAFRNVRRIYRACGAEKQCHLVIGHGGHRFYADAAWPVMLKLLAVS